MADIRNYGFIRHFRTEPTLHVLRYRLGKLLAEGPGLGFWFLPLSTSIVEVPVDDRELMLMFRTRSADFQDVTVQGVVSYRVADPNALARRVDFTLDVQTGAYTKEPLEKLSLTITQLAQQLTAAYVTATPVREILVDGYARIRQALEQGLHQDPTATALGLEIVSVRVSSVRPTAELEKALEIPVREGIQQRADQASFERRAMAVEKERAIQENELQNQIELARREQQLIEQRGANELDRVQQAAQAERVNVQGEAERTRIQSAARAEGLRVVERAKAEGEQARMDVYRDLPPAVLYGLAAQQLAGKLQRIEHLNLSPDLLGPMVQRLMQAGTERLEGEGKP